MVVKTLGVRDLTYCGTPTEIKLLRLTITINAIAEWVNLTVCEDICPRLPNLV